MWGLFLHPAVTASLFVCLDCWHLCDAASSNALLAEQPCELMAMAHPMSSLRVSISFVKGKFCQCIIAAVTCIFGVNANALLFVPFLRQISPAFPLHVPPSCHAQHSREHWQTAV